MGVHASNTSKMLFHPFPIIACSVRLLVVEEDGISFIGYRFILSLFCFLWPLRVCLPFKGTDEYLRGPPGIMSLFLSWLSILPACYCYLVWKGLMTCYISPCSFQHSNIMLHHHYSLMLSGLCLCVMRRCVYALALHPCDTIPPFPLCQLLHLFRGMLEGCFNAFATDDRWCANATNTLSSQSTCLQWWA